MKVISLFDGMSCARIALDRANIPVTEYYSSEIDKYAIQVSKANYPGIIQLGDVQDISCLLYTSPSPRDGLLSRMPSSA